MKREIAVLGDGGWGTALSIILNSKGEKVTLWGVFPEYISLLEQKRENIKFLPKIKIPKAIKLTSNLKEALTGKKIIILAIPSQHLREICKKMKPYFLKDTLIISVSKGIENKTLKRMSEVIKEELGAHKIAVLSGPSHAEETIRNCPTTVVAACYKKELALKVQKLLFTDTFRIYTHSDIVGVELGGALKNVIAIAAGMCTGLNLGSNATSALLTRGIAEITRLGMKMGAKKGTFSGLSGIGDLITTCISEYGRNKTFGQTIAGGKSQTKVLRETEMVVEGVATAKSAYALAKQYQVETPIINAVYAVLYKNIPPKQALAKLMSRSPKSEEEDIV